jgi:hypothetical protein
MEDMAASSGDVAAGEVMSPMGTPPAEGAQPLATQANTEHEWLK